MAKKADSGKQEAKVKKDKKLTLGNKTFLKAKGLKTGKEKDVMFLLKESKEGSINSIIKKAFVNKYGYTEDDFHGKIT